MQVPHVTLFTVSFEALQNPEHPKVRLTCHCEAVTLELDDVTALGIVIPELIANSYRHAFLGGTGSISVSLLLGQSGDDATIVFADDGVGFAEGGDSNRQGLRLVRRLIEQVSGTATLCSDYGTEWTLTFPVPTVPTAPASITTRLA
jgi:two-component sensor histidine kinase